MAQWQTDLEPRPEHFDKRVTVATPLQKAGAYLVDGQDGRRQHQLHRPLGRRHGDRQEAAGRQDLLLRGRRRHRQAVAEGQRRVLRLAAELPDPTAAASKSSPSNSPSSPTPTARCMPDPQQQPQDYQWLVTARDARKGGSPTWASRNVWYGATSTTPSTTPTKVYTITDRPVYRPEQTVKYKFWIRHAQYDHGRHVGVRQPPFTVEIHNPKGEKIVSVTKQGRRLRRARGRIHAAGRRHAGRLRARYLRHGARHFGGGSFRVEEYKKPEFEVTVDAPTEPVMLGEKISATIKAKYYFGSPVTKAKVKYKINRTSYDRAGIRRWPWDWLYGPGYWWFAYDYAWYPGWRALGLPAAAAVLVAARPTAARAGRRAGSGHRARRHGQSRDRHGRGQGHPSRPGPQLHDHGRGGRPVAADDRRHGHGAGRPQAVHGLRLGRSRLLPRRRHDPRPLRGPHARRQAGRRAAAS